MRSPAHAGWGEANLKVRLAVIVLLSAILIMLGVTNNASAVEPSTPPQNTATAIFAGGCFWCMEPPFEALPGVVSVTSGYIGGKTPNPTYEEVSRGNTGYAEAVQIVYDPAKVSYAQLLDVFWVNIDPVDPGGQFCDRGSQYRSGIFYMNQEQQRLAEESKAKLEADRRFGKGIATEISSAGTFYPAEEYHQDFYKKNPTRYYTYRIGCGRDRQLQRLWGQPKQG